MNGCVFGALAPSFLMIKQQGISAPLAADAPARLLEAALTLFTTKGYAATAVREIVEAAGVTKPMLYYYFGNKEGLYVALMRGSYAVFEETLAALQKHRGTARERILFFCLGLFDCFRAHIPRVRLIYAMYFGPPQGAPAVGLEQYFDNMLQSVRFMIEEGVAAGELRSKDPAIHAWAVVASLNTVMKEQLFRPDPHLDRDGLAQVLALILDQSAGNVGPGEEG